MQCPLCGSRALMRDYAPPRGYAFLVFGAFLLIFSRIILPALLPLFVINGMENPGHPAFIFTEEMQYAIKQLSIVGVLGVFLGAWDIMRNQNRYCVVCGFKGRFIKRKFDAKTEQALEAFKPKVDTNSPEKKSTVPLAKNQPLKPLMKMLGFKDEKIRKDALNTLKEITGENFGEDQDAWEEWHKSKRADKSQDGSDA